MSQCTEKKATSMMFSAFQSTSTATAKLSNGVTLQLLAQSTSPMILFLRTTMQQFNLYNYPRLALMHSVQLTLPIQSNTKKSAAALGKMYQLQ